MGDKYACVMFKCAADADTLNDLLTKFGFKPWKVTLQEPDYVDAMSAVLNEMHVALVKALSDKANKEKQHD